MVEDLSGISARLFNVKKKNLSVIIIGVKKVTKHKSESLAEDHIRPLKQRLISISKLEAFYSSASRLLEYRTWELVCNKYMLTNTLALEPYILLSGRYRT